MGTVAWSWYIDKKLKPLSKYVGLSSVFEVERGEETAEVLRLRAGHPVTWSQSNLNRRRYAQNDDTLYVAPEDERTDYSQPPMANWYSGVLNTGKRRYGHPALNGVLPEPWLPLKKGQTLVNQNNGNHRTKDDGQAVVLTLRKRYNSLRSRSSRGNQEAGPSSPTADRAHEIPPDAAAVANPWGDARPSVRRAQAQSAPILQHRLSFDHGSGVIMLPDNGDWLDLGESDEDSDEERPDEAQPTGGGLEQSVASIASTESTAATPVLSPTRTSRYGTYFHHPERRKQTIPGAFPFPGR